MTSDKQRAAARAAAQALARTGDLGAVLEAIDDLPRMAEHPGGPEHPSEPEALEAVAVEQWELAAHPEWEPGQTWDERQR